MRAAAAALPEPCSATTSTGTSFCDNSRITASTVRIPALTLSSQTRALPFCGVAAVARSLVLSRSMLFLFRIAIAAKTAGETSWTKGLRTLEHTHCQSSQKCPRAAAALLADISTTCDQRPLWRLAYHVTTLRTNGKTIAHIFGNVWGLLSTCFWEIKSQLSGITGQVTLD